MRVKLLSIPLVFAVWACSGGSKTFLKADPENVMRTLFSHYDESKKTSTWKCTDTRLLEKFELTDPSTFVSELLYLDSMTSDNGIKQLCVIIASHPEEDEYTCHGCSPVQEFILFDKNDKGWELTSRDVFAQMGSWGASPPFEVQEVGKNKKGFMFFPGFTNQGYTTENLVLYTLYEDSFRNVLEIEDVYGDNAGNCDEEIPNDCWEYSYSLKFLKGKGELYDIEFGKTGNTLEDGKIVSIDLKERYQFKEGKYRKI